MYLLTGHHLTACVVSILQTHNVSNFMFQIIHLILTQMCSNELGRVTIIIFFKYLSDL